MVIERASVRSRIESFCQGLEQSSRLELALAELQANRHQLLVAPVSTLLDATVEELYRRTREKALLNRSTLVLEADEEHHLVLGANLVTDGTSRFHLILRASNQPLCGAVIEHSGSFPVETAWWAEAQRGPGSGDDILCPGCRSCQRAEFISTRDAVDLDAAGKSLLKSNLSLLLCESALAPSIAEVEKDALITLRCEFALHLKQ